MPNFDALLLWHISWVIEIESEPRKIASSQRYEVKKLAQYRWEFQIFYRNALFEGIIMEHLNQKLVSVISK